MTLRLSCLFEDKLKQLFYNWKSSKRSPKKKSSPSQSDQHRSGPTTRRSTATHTNGNHDDDDSDDDDVPLRNGRSGRRNAQYATSNGVSSSVNTEPIAGPSTSRGHTRRGRAHSIEAEQLPDTSSNSSSSSSDSDGSDGSDEEPSIPLSALGTNRSRRRNSDSEESYKPNRRIMKPKRRKKRKEDKKDKIKKSNGTTRIGRPPKQRIVHSDEDYAVNNRNSESPKKSISRPKRNQRVRESSSSSEGEPKRGRKVRKLRGYSSDNSCNLNNSLAERNPLETDSDSQMARPRRGRKKKTFTQDADSPDDQPFTQRHTAPQSSQV